jgi:hypothetical protein
MFDWIGTAFAILWNSVTDGKTRQGVSPVNRDVSSETASLGIMPGWRRIRFRPDFLFQQSRGASLATEST